MGMDREQQVEALYHSALMLEAGERAKFLAQACRGDEELRREVESLLRQAGSLLEHPVWELLEPKPSTRLGPYEIVAKIGEGGMGEVYRATDTRLDRLVAIKFLSSRMADPAARRRFQREAKMASSLNHPHILTVYEAGEFEGRQYLVTEFVDAAPCTSGRRPPSVAGARSSSCSQASPMASRPRMPREFCIATSSPPTFCS